jgi:hypothetical protein
MLIAAAPIPNNSRVIAGMAPSFSVQYSSVVERLGRSLVAMLRKIVATLVRFAEGRLTAD